MRTSDADVIRIDFPHSAVADNEHFPRSKSGHAAERDNVEHVADAPPGRVSEAEYLAIKRRQLVEFDDGGIEVLPVPTLFHQAIVDFLHGMLNKYLEGKSLGKAFFAPVPVWLWEGKYREPDVFFLRAERIGSMHTFPRGADLVIEVVSESEESRQRQKRNDYARAGIPEYWIVDPETRSVLVLFLDCGAYRVHGQFAAAQTASSRLLPGFEVDVHEVFAAGEQPMNPSPTGQQPTG